MDLDRVIQHLRDRAPTFQGRVAGAAELAVGVQDAAQMALPAAYVIPLDEEAEANSLANALRQKVMERIGVVVEFDNRADRRGQTIASLFDATRAELWAALLNWRVDPVRAVRGLEYAGGRLGDWDRARLFYQWDFTLELTITDRMGWQEPLEPLVEVDLAVTRADTGQALAAAVIHPPQS